MRYATIMAGGAGTRLWPMSRSGEPKQLIRFIHGRGPKAGDGSEAGPASLIQLAASRLDGLVDESRCTICTGERFRGAVLNAVPGMTDDRILGEPEGRDTLNAVGFAAAVFGKDDPDAVFAVLTADHLIEPADVFAEAMDAGFRIVEDDPTKLVTFGITPTYAATGFGYIERGNALHLDGVRDGLSFRVQRFVEKPPPHKAQAFFESGEFFWNAGMFVFHAQTVFDLLGRHKPKTLEGLMRIREAWGTDTQTDVLNEVYPTLEKISVDYGMMEPASSDEGVSIAGVTMDVDWLDVGSWPSYGETLEPDADGNRVAGTNLIAHDAKNNVVVGPGAGDDHQVALLGCEGLIVVRTPKATLVMPADRAQDLKALHALVPDELK